MPATTSPAVETRVCQDGCGRTLPATEEFFYVAPGSGRMWYGCRECVRANRAEARRQRAAAGVVVSQSREANLARRRGRIVTAPATPRRARRAAARLAGRTFGVEIEFTGVSQYVVRDALRAARLGRWEVKSDGTPGVDGEVVSPPLSGESGREEVRRACDAIQSTGARVSRACGLHVHHGVGDLDVGAFRRVARIWYESQAAIAQLVSPSRRSNAYARPLSEHDVAAIESLRDLNRMEVRRVARDRYRALNYAAYPRHGTIEVRQHQGTIDATKILAWIDLGQAVLEAAKGFESGSADLGVFLDRLVQYGLPRETRSYLARRAARLSDSPYARAGR